MKKRTKYSDEPMELQVIKDFLPTPDQLALLGRRVKVSVEISQSSLEFFKKQAGKSKTGPAEVIGTLIDAYANEYRGQNPRQ